jgi:hypothetical protein
MPEREQRTRNAARMLSEVERKQLTVNLGSEAGAAREKGKSDLRAGFI